MNVKNTLRIAATCALVLLPGTASAQGLFDFLDPCIGARNDYWKARNGILTKVDTKLAGVATAQPTKEFSDYWWTEKRVALRTFFDANIVPVLEGAGIKEQKMLDAAFETWLEKQIHGAGGHEAMNKLVAEEYRRVLGLALLKQKGETVAALDKQRDELYSSCPQDVANQMFRGLITVTVAPIGIVTQNLEIAKRESGDLAKVLAGTTGISVDAINKGGILGGENSEARKACNAVAGLVGGRCE
jgi:hypothetical protein